MSNKMPDELKEAFQILEKWQYRDSLNIWYDFNDLRKYERFEFRLKKEKPLTVEEARKESIVYLPHVYTPSRYETLTASYSIASDPALIDANARKGLAYRYIEGATAHAQAWLDMDVHND